MGQERHPHMIALHGRMDGVRFAHGEGGWITWDILNVYEIYV